MKFKPLMKPLPASLLLLSSLLLTACASEPQRTASGRPLKLETIRRPYGPTVYAFRPVNEPVHRSSHD